MIIYSINFKTINERSNVQVVYVINRLLIKFRYVFLFIRVFRYYASIYTLSRGQTKNISGDTKVGNKFTHITTDRHNALAYTSSLMY